MPIIGGQVDHMSKWLPDRDHEWECKVEAVLEANINCCPALEPPSPAMPGRTFVPLIFVVPQFLFP